MNSANLESVKAIVAAAIDLTIRADVVWISAHSKTLPAYHVEPDCNIAARSAKTRVITTRESAEAAGAKPCADCGPGKRSDK